MNIEDIKTATESVYAGQPVVVISHRANRETAIEAFRVLDQVVAIHEDEDPKVNGVSVMSLAEFTASY